MGALALAFSEDDTRVGSSVVAKDVFEDGVDVTCGNVVNDTVPLNILKFSSIGWHIVGFLWKQPTS